MTTTLLGILLAAFVIDWIFGEPEWLWQRVPHPVVWFGKAVGLADRLLNAPGAKPEALVRNGAVALVMLLIFSVLAGMALTVILRQIGFVGLFAEAVIASVFLAQKSLRDHVADVATGLRNGGLEGGRRAVAKIVGRDPQTLDRAGVSRAALESLSENFADGVVAPAFWYAVFGLPGLLAYKMINTADSMIGHRNERYLHFGRVAAQVDDVVNILPARLSALLIAAGAWAVRGVVSAREALSCAMRDARLHRSPNSGWGEAAMAGALGVALGGPRIYGGEAVSQAHMNAAGRLDIDAAEIDAGLSVFRAACFASWILTAFLFVLALYVRTIWIGSA